MPASDDNVLNPSEIDNLGAAAYERLWPILETDHWNRFVAIHVLTGDYSVDASTARAMRAMRKRHTSGQLFLRKIGNEPEYGLAARLLAGEMQGSAISAASQTK